MRTVRSAGFAFFCVLVIAAIVVPAARAQRKAAPDVRPARRGTLAQEKINARVLGAIYHRRGDAKGKTVPGDGSRHPGRPARPRARGRPRPGPAGAGKENEGARRNRRSTSSTYDSIVGWMPLLTLERLAADPTVRAIEPAQ